jgi:hypothetical protein
MAIAFQADAFQNDAFQILAAVLHDLSGKDIGICFLEPAEPEAWKTWWFATASGTSVLTAQSISGGRLYVWNGTTWILIGPSVFYSVAAGTISGLPDSSQVVVLHPSPVLIAFPAGLGTSKGKALVAATANTVFSIKKNGVEVGTMTFAAAGTQATFAAASSFSFDPASNDYMTVVAPGAIDDTLRDIGFGLLGVRS